MLKIIIFFSKNIIIVKYTSYYNAEGEKQLIGYLDRFGLDTGYMLSFNFNKNKTVGVERITIGGKTLYEGTL